MKQVDFEYLVMQDMKITRQLTRHLINSLTVLVKKMVRSGDLAIIVNLGVFFAWKRNAMNYKDWRTNTWRQAIAINMPAMRTWSYPKQQCTPTWVPVRWDNKTHTHGPVVFIGQKPNPDSNFAHFLQIETALDLLIINEFINSFGKLITAAVVSGDKVIINNLGTFMKQYHAPHKIWNVRNGSYMTIPAFDTLKFRPSTNWIKELN